MKDIREINLVITHACNLRCTYCYEVNKNHGEMSVELAKELITKLLSKKTCDQLAINFFGGEPMLRFPFVKEICEWTWAQTWSQEYIFYVDTNGVDIDEDAKQWASSNKDRFIMLLSLDGTPKTHNANRSGSFNKIDIDFFKKNWLQYGVKMTISDQCLDNLAEDIIFLHNLGFKVKGANIAEGIIMKDFDEKFKIIKEQYSKLVDWYIAHPGTPVAQIFDLDLSLCETHKKRNIKFCGCGTDATKVIDIDGQEYPCTYFFPLAMGKNELMKIKEIDLSNEKNFINQDCVDNCYIYPICKGCYGDNYSTTGSLSHRSQQRCQLAKLRALAVATLHAAKFLSVNYKQISKHDKNTITAIEKINSLFMSIKGDADSL